MAEASTPMIHVYETDFGSVRISEDEARLVQLGIDARRFNAVLPFQLQAMLAHKLDEIEAVARWRYEAAH